MCTPQGFDDVFPIMFKDLVPEAQAAFLKAMDLKSAAEGNYDVFPIAELLLDDCDCDDCDCDDDDDADCGCDGCNGCDSDMQGPPSNPFEPPPGHGGYPSLN